MASELCHECQKISLQALTSTDGFEYHNFINMFIIDPSPCALCALVREAFGSHVLENARGHECHLTLWVQSDHIHDLFVVLDPDSHWAPPIRAKWLGTYPTFERQYVCPTDREIIVKSFRIIAKRGTEQIDMALLL